MSGLPARFPRSSLIQQAALLESRIQRLLDETQDRINEAEDRGMSAVTRKLAQRFNALDTARQYANDARQALFDLP